MAASSAGTRTAVRNLYKQVTNVITYKRFAKTYHVRSTKSCRYCGLERIILEVLIT